MSVLIHNKLVLGVELTIPIELILNLANSESSGFLISVILRFISVKEEP